MGEVLLKRQDFWRQTFVSLQASAMYHQQPASRFEKVIFYQVLDGVERFCGVNNIKR
jgi:hypothetical protein